MERRQEKKKRGSGECEEEGRCAPTVYRATCRLCNLNGGSGVSWRIVRSRGATSRGHSRRCRHGRKGGRKEGENRSEGGVS